MRLAALTLCLALLPAVPVVTDTYPRQSAVDALHYRFAVTLTDTSAHLEGEATATFRILATVESIDLDLMNTMRVTAVHVASAPVSFSHDGNRLRLALPAAVRPGDDVSYTISYSGAPSDGLQAFTNIHGERVMFSEGWPNRARHWLPMIDHPYDKATGEMIITAPARWQVVSNGSLVEEVDLPGDLRRTHWRQSVPIASWLYAVGVARFSAHHAGMVVGIPVQTWSFPQDATAARTLFEETSRRALEFFASRVGPYPYEKLANVQASGFGGGMENATVIFYGEKGVAAGRGPVVHEVAHQWFGNSVTESDWDDVWLSEGFASYFTHLFREHDEGRDAFVDALQRSRTNVLQLGRKLPDTPVVHQNIDDMSRVLNGLVYEKGAWVLHMLRAEVGLDHFWSGIREYYRRYRDGNASTSDFRQVMEQVSGRNLQPFFRQWLNRGGHPILNASWKYDADRKLVVLSVQQTQAGEPYSLALEVAVRSAGTSETHRVALSDRSTIVELSSERLPEEVTLDPATWVLAEMTLTRGGA
jgi:aminopeptidase N